MLKLIDVKWGRSSRRRSSGTLFDDDGSLHCVSEHPKTAAMPSRVKTPVSDAAKAACIPSDVVDPSAASSGAKACEHSVHPPGDPVGPPLDADTLPPPPDPPEPAAGDAQRGGGKRGRARLPKHPRSFHWGPHLVSFKPPNAWAGSCARNVAHRWAGHANTRCTRSISFKGKERWGE